MWSACDPHGVITSDIALHLWPYLYNPEAVASLDLAL